MRHGEVGAHGVDENLQPDAEGLADRVEQPGAAAGAGLKFDDDVVHFGPASGHVVDHAHGAHDAGVAHGRAEEVGGVGVEHGRGFKTFAGESLGEKAQHEDHDPAEDGDQSEIGMQDEDQGKVDGHPRNVEKGEHGVAAEKVAEHLHVAQVALFRGSSAGRNRGVFEVFVEHGKAQHPVELNAGPDEKAGAYPFKQRQHDEGDNGGDGDDGQGGQVVAGQYLIVHLQHVDGKRELEHVDEHTEKKGVSEKVPAGA